jgi:hypothetical protein
MPLMDDNAIFLPLSETWRGFYPHESVIDVQ